MKAENITHQEFQTIIAIERTCSGISLLGSFFIIITFLSTTAFRKPINRLVFYASLGNLFTNLATLISRSALGKPDGRFCQFQAFLIQMFLPADAYWTLAMACNVMFAFFFQFDVIELRRLEKWYMLLCYGVPFIPAFVFFFVHTREKGYMYGSAISWCWIDSKWTWWRLWSFYVPVWITIFITIMIYTVAGKKIYDKRQELVTANQRTSPASLPKLRQEKSSQTELLPTNTNKETTSPSPTKPVLSPPQKSKPSNPPNKQANTALWAYAKVSLLFFLAMMITWIPSTANRIYSICYPGMVNMSLQYISVFVLPLQGFWNALIYVFTSRDACRVFWGRMREGIAIGGFF
ncbi:hypothetical protein SS1G_11756 [Sclerotinia sclerotiorum 1980 UF-70]|uniref:G-protein coupled receptors family 2 profile 2 domain-containing protein n=2 Tax=Sclerotinia sclerotiorum (strain ATCC 18683 / 1980 / Ss-1) TaxID=665079 RepID=A7F3B0_SCLS1|nr:hypothetical protein SS1G_11756 [Sclerotinia sclerotiorum 1980 UF-70]APA14404.1 hypothetical protein sscle_12g091740 [Sclerotinia sclerotiorum 1980 UF-70]EDN97231.1 hypothetical protein SS1G_11756 [Sclerotinia sclerotiorum 1980 UF-70]